MMGYVLTAESQLTEGAARGQLAFCSEDVSHVPAKGGIYLLCILATQLQLLFVEKSELVHGECT